MFSYLCKKINIENVTELFCIDWCKNQGTLSIGGSFGFLNVLEIGKNTIAPLSLTSRKIIHNNHIHDEGGERGHEDDGDGVGEKGKVVELNQCLEGHSSSSRVIKVCWNKGYEKFVSCDSNGTIIVWMKEVFWLKEMVMKNYNSKISTVKDLKWSNDGKKICVCYQDGILTVGNVAGRKIWKKQFECSFKKVEWSPNNNTLLVITYSNDVMIIQSENGDSISNMKVNNGELGKEISCIEWSSSFEFTLLKEGGSKSINKSLCICYKSGEIELYKDELDDYPIIVNSKLKITDCKWNVDGSILAVAGLEFDTKQNYVNFYDNCGMLFHKLHVRHTTTSQKINCISWDRYSLNLSIVIGNTVYFAVVKKNYKFAKLNDTLIYSFKDTTRNEDAIVFWNIKDNNNSSTNNGKTMARVKALQDLGKGESFVYVIRKEENTKSFNLIMYDEKGNHINNKEIHNFTPKFSCALGDEYIIVASNHHILGLKNPLNRDNKEMTFNVNDPLCKFVDRKNIVKEEEASSDEICCLSVCLSKVPLFMIGRTSGKYQIYRVSPTISFIQLKTEVSLKFSAKRVFFTPKRLAIIDTNSNIRLFSIEFSAKYKLKKIKKLKYDFRENILWDFRWSDTIDDLFCMNCKGELLVVKDLNVIDKKRKFHGYLCDFNNNEVGIVLLDDILRNPLKFYNSVKDLSSYIFKLQVFNYGNKNIDENNIEVKNLPSTKVSLDVLEKMKNNYQEEEEGKDDDDDDDEKVLRKVKKGSKKSKKKKKSESDQPKSPKVKRNRKKLKFKSVDELIKMINEEDNKKEIIKRTLKMKNKENRDLNDENKRLKSSLENKDKVIKQLRKSNKKLRESLSSKDKKIQSMSQKNLRETNKKDLEFLLDSK